MAYIALLQMLLPEPEKQGPSTGFAFFGIRDANGSWSERNFKLPPSVGDRPPQVNDEIIADTSVNIRKLDFLFGSNGWINQPSTGVLKTGEHVKVVETREVVDGFWWISFYRVGK